MAAHNGVATLFDRPLDIRVTLEEVLDDLDEGWASWTTDSAGEVR